MPGKGQATFPCGLRVVAGALFAQLTRTKAVHLQSVRHVMFLSALTRTETVFINTTLLLFMDSHEHLSWFELYK